MNLFPQAPVIDFFPAAEYCPVCGGVPHVLKTRCKGLVTLMIGPFTAREHVMSSSSFTCRWRIGIASRA